MGARAQRLVRHRAVNGHLVPVLVRREMDQCLDATNGLATGRREAIGAGAAMTFLVWMWAWFRFLTRPTRLLLCGVCRSWGHPAYSGDYCTDCEKRRP